MAVVLRVMVLCLLVHGCVCSVGQTNKGCMKWNMLSDTNEACCEECYPGNVLVKKCGPNASALCAPCETGTYAESLKSDKCHRCRICVGALVQVKACTPTSNTVCGCKGGLVCGDARCSFCVTECGKGQEPAEKRSCRPCPDGTFNDRVHQPCKPWSTSCPKPDQVIVAKGDALTDIQCANVSAPPVRRPNQPDGTGQVWLMISGVTSMVLTGFIIIAAVKILRKKKRQPKKTKAETKTPIIRIPTDDPRTLIAIECSFHEAQQEQGSSTESLDSKDSSDSSGQLLA